MNTHLSGLSQSELNSDGYDCYSPPYTRIYELFLDPTTPFSDETYPEGGSLDHRTGVSFSQSSANQQDDRSEEPRPATSTPDLSFTASSSPCRFAMRESPALHATSSGHLPCGNVALLEPTPGHASFSQRLNYLLKKAADQQYQPRTGERMRIQPDLLKEVPDSDSALGLKLVKNYGSPPSVFPPQKLQRSFSLGGGASDGSTHAVISDEAGYDSRPTKRKSGTFDSNILLTDIIHKRAPSDSYLSASDGASPAPSHCLDVLLPSPPKKRRRLSSNVSQVSAILSPLADSSVVSGTHSMRSVSLPTRKSRGSIFRYASKGVQCPSPFHCPFRDKPDLEVVVPSRPSSTCGSDYFYPPTEIATPSPDLSPAPILDVQDFPKASIPRVFWSDDDAAVARLMSLLRREARFYQGEGLDASVDPDFTLQDTIVPEVIAWMLKVHAFTPRVFTNIVDIFMWRRSSHPWALRQLHRSGGGYILTICMNK